MWYHLSSRRAKEERPRIPILSPIQWRISFPLPGEYDTQTAWNNQEPSKPIHHMLPQLPLAIRFHHQGLSLEYRWPAQADTLATPLYFSTADLSRIAKHV